MGRSEDDAQSPLQPSPLGDTPQSERPLKASKDHTCPFCMQPFTSSSLGRHLDLYIRPNNPKPADEFHDVAKIRAMRSRITRRQPRNSRGAGQDPDDQNSSSRTSQSPAASRIFADAANHEQDLSRGMLTDPSLSRHDGSNHGNLVHQDRRQGGMIRPLNARPQDPVTGAFNTANWQATGVINNIPPNTTAPSLMFPITTTALPTGSTSFARHDPTRIVSPVNGQPSRELPGPALTPDLNDLEMGKAAQYALTEVLDCIHAARAHMSSDVLFDFDYFGTNFAALCLHLIPGSIATHGNDSFVPRQHWSLEPPSDQQYDDLRIAIENHVRRSNIPTTEDELDSILDHLANAYRHWKTLEEDQKLTMWKNEGLRAYVRSKESERSKDAELFQVKQQLELLRRQSDLLRHGDPLSSEKLLTTLAEPLTMSRQLCAEVQVQQPEYQRWEYGNLIAKWGDRIRAARPQYLSTAAANIAQLRAATDCDAGLENPTVMDVDHAARRPVDVTEQVNKGAGPSPGKRKLPPLAASDLRHKRQARSPP